MFNKKCDFCFQHSKCIERVMYANDFRQICFSCWNKFGRPKDAVELILTLQLKFPSLIEELVERWNNKKVQPL